MSAPTRRVLELLGPSAGGIRRHVDVLARHLPEVGWEPTVAGPAGVMTGLGADAEVVGVSLSPARVPGAVRRVRRLARDVEVVHAHGLTAGWLGWAAHTGRPLVVTVHNLVLDEAAGRAAPVLRRLEGWLPGRVARLVAVSPQIAARFDPDGTRGDVQVIVPASPPPMATRDRQAIRATLELADHDPLVVTVARLHPQKAIGDLLKAAADLRNQVPDLRVAVVGDGPERAALEAEAADLGLGGCVSFVGAQPDGPSWLAAADVAVVSSIWEGSPLVVAEALQLGVPLVATDVGDVAEIVHDGETGRLVRPSAPDELAAAIAGLLADPAGASRLAAAGQALARERYGRVRLVAAVGAVYDEVTR